MKLITNTKLAIASALCAVVFTTAAQAQGVRVTVPFKFRAGSAVVPAGDYAVQVDRAHGRVTPLFDQCRQLRGRACHQVVGRWIAVGRDDHATA